MSFIFDVDGETVWSPNLATGMEFNERLNTLAATGDLNAGVRRVSDDMVDFDGTALREFFLASVPATGDRWPIRRGLDAGTYAAIAVMLLRAGRITSDELVQHNSVVAALVESLSSAMPDG